MERRLTAILAADVVDYSRLMGEDQAAALDALRRLRRELFEPLVASHGGRVVKRLGDGWIVEFASIADAVGCSIEVQEGLVVQDSVKLRIGIHIGDVTFEEEDVFGEGVNVAARLEGLAQPGEILISDTAHHGLDQKTAQLFAGGKSQHLKNIVRPVAIWRWPTVPSSLPAAAGSLEPGTLTLPDKPSIAVLPFNNMSGDPEQEYFSDGVSEDLTTALSRIDWLFVIARNSAFAYRGTAVDVKRVGQELGVRYVLEGSVRRAGSRVRINAQLIDAESERHVWAERFDRQMDDVFELQDDIVASIAATVGPEITLAEIERSRGRRPETLGAWDHHLQAIAAYSKMTKESVAQAIDHLEQAVAMEPRFAKALALLALCHSQNGMYGWIKPVRGAYEEASRIAHEAVRLAPTSPEANHALAFILMVTGNASQAVTAARRAIELNPNFAEAFAVLGQALIFRGDIEEGLEACIRAARNNPRDTRGSWLYDALGHAYFMLGDYEQAIVVSEKGIHQDPTLAGAHVTLAGAHALLGHEDEAQRYVDDILRPDPALFAARAAQESDVRKARAHRQADRKHAAGGASGIARS